MFVEDIPRQIFCLCNSGGCRTRSMSWKNGAWGDAGLGAIGSAKQRSQEEDMGIFLFTILCFKSAGRSARVAAEGLQFLGISSIRVAERKEEGSKTSPGRGSRRRCPKWNSPRLLHVLHFFHTMLCSVLHLFPHRPLTLCVKLCAVHLSICDDRGKTPWMQPGFFGRL